MPGQQDHWNAHARAWQHLGPPLRPSPDDVAIFARAIDRAASAAKGRPLVVVLLGVTPELAQLNLPAGSQLLAIDRSDGMLAGVWPGDSGSRRAIRAAWRSMPLPDRCADLLLGDGCYTVLDQPQDRDAVNAEVGRVLRDDGRFVVRQFLRPQAAESPDAIFDDLLAGNIGSFHAFKWRLAAALHQSPQRGLRVDDVWQEWASRNIDLAALAQRNGWPHPVVQTINNYRGSEAHYYIPTLAEARAELARRFNEVDQTTGHYELAALFPILWLSPARQSSVTSEPAAARSWSAPRSVGSARRQRSTPDAT